MDGVSQFQRWLIRLFMLYKLLEQLQWRLATNLRTMLIQHVMKECLAAVETAADVKGLGALAFAVGVHTLTSKFIRVTLDSRRGLVSM